MANASDGEVVLVNPYNYTCSNKGLLLPAISEATWSDGARAFLYLLALFWCFLAVAIIADVFMCAIERITSKTTKIRMPDQTAAEGFREYEVRVWNDTVANLTLLALGTSAPEILLSVIEIVGKGFESGDLGPGTIVGSAAFNLLVISAICISCIPAGQVRRVKSIKVFGVTAFSCVLAYVWMALVLLAISPEVVEIWEAIITLLFFPTLVLVAYLADRNCCMGKAKPTQNGFYGISMGAEDEEAPTTEEDAETEIHKLAKELGREEDLPEDEAARIAALKMEEHRSHDRGWYRINATRTLTGGKKLIPKVLHAFKQLHEHVRTPEDERTGPHELTKHVDMSEGGLKPVLEFTAASVAVLENEGKVRLGIKRHGRLDCPVTVRVETLNGTAVSGEDYKHFDERVTFQTNERLRQVFVEIVDDCEWEPDEFFFVKMVAVEECPDVAFGSVSICQVVIINEDEPGTLEFVKPSFVIMESKRRALIPVQRLGGADGHVTVKWVTKDITAVSGTDYQGGEGELTFDNQETTRTIEIPIFDSDKAERDDSFGITLTETGGGAQLGKISRTIVTVVNDEEFNGLVSRIVSLTKANLDSLQLDSSTYVTQFKNALNVNGGDLANATFVDYVLHFLTFFWKILFAFVPPPKYLGGWPTFLISLGVIGFMTAIIGDLASVFGCLIGLEDSITAITLVALGTSMPDTFASKTAAIMERFADSSVGNVNGSNSVNVFLGLGLPWVIASIYHASKGSVFRVPAGSLGFSVVLYAVAAVIALLILVLRRSVRALGGAELGGPLVPKVISSFFLILLWVLYVLLSSLQAKGIISVSIGVPAPGTGN